MDNNSQTNIALNRIEAEPKSDSQIGSLEPFSWTSLHRTDLCIKQSQINVIQIKIILSEPEAGIWFHISQVTAEQYVGIQRSKERVCSSDSVWPI